MKLPESAIQFSLVVQIFKGTTIIRAGPSRILWRFLLAMPTGKSPVTAFALTSNPLEVSETSASWTPCPDPEALERGKPNEDREYLKPSEKNWWNRTKATPSSVKLLDSGKVTFYIVNGFWKFLVSGKHLKGLFTLTRENTSDLWTWKKGVGPGEKRE